MADSTQKRNFQPLDELGYAHIGSAKLSPDNKWAIYELTKNDLEKDEIITSLWRVNLETGENTPLTLGNKNSTSPEWSPDGKQIAFLSTRDGLQQAYIMPSDGGEAVKLTDMKQGVGGGPTWSPDGQTIAFTAGRDIAPIDPTKPYRVTRFVYRFDGVGYLDGAVQNIFVQSVKGGTPKQLTHDEHLNQGMRWSPDSKEILYAASHDPDRPDLFFSKLRVVNLDGEIEELLGLDSGVYVMRIWGGAWNANWTPDGSKIVFVATSGKFPMGAKLDLWIMDRKNGTPELRTADLKWGSTYDGFGKVLNADTTLMSIAKEGTITIYSVALNGEPHWQEVISGQRTALLEDSSDSKILFLSGCIENPGELCIANIDGSGERQITNVNGAFMDEIAYPKVEHIHFQSEGVEVAGWLMLPNTGEAPYPTILYIHGGPHGAYGFNYSTDFQMLAGAGYAVLFTNPRGSRGYGDDFTTALSGNWGVMDYKDLMAGVDYVIEQGYADPDRLGVCGLSYGGFMTTFTVGQTRRFKAAVAENPITDLVSRYGTADMGPWGSISELGGKPHEIPDVYRNSSPITYAHLCTTPTLLVQGELDYRCPVGQGEQFYSHLKANGCITEMVRLPGMPHVASINGPLIVQKTQNDELLAWMNKYVLGVS